MNDRLETTLSSVVLALEETITLYPLHFRYIQVFLGALKLRKQVVSSAFVYTGIFTSELSLGIMGNDCPGVHPCLSNQSKCLARVCLIGVKTLRVQMM